jgi:chitodextrinase
MPRSISVPFIVVWLVLLLAGSVRAQTTTGLVAAYGFDEGTGTAIRDASGQNNNGTSSGTTWTTGKFGNALVFNGTSAKVTVPNAPSLQLTTGMTLEAWIFPTRAPTGWRAIVDKNVDGYYIMASTDNGNRPGVGGTWTDGNKNLFGPSVVPVNTWTHLAATFDGSATRLFVNGVQVASQAQTAPLKTTTATLQIGADSYPSEFFAGLIDEVRIYNRALSAAEIQSDMATPVSSVTPPVSDTAPPSAPPALSATAASATQINLSWTAATDNVGVTGYRVERCQGSGCTTFSQIFTLSGTTFNNTGLTASTSYSYRVRAIDAAGNLGPYSSVASATTLAAPDTTAPTAPSGLSATAAGSTQINLSWSAATDNVGVLGYQLERCAGSGCSAFAQIAAPAGTSFGDTGLAAGTSYSYRVRALDGAGNLGGYSPVASATTPAPDLSPPTAPTGLTATSAGSGQINLTWAASTDDVGVTGYRVERCAGSGCSAFVQIATPTGTSFSNTGLAPNTSYTYQVRAADAAGNLGAYSNFASATTATASGPVAAYAFSEASGATTADASGNGNTGTLNGATRTTAGQFGSAVVVSGSGAYVDLGNGPTLQITGSMTISAWIRPAAFPADDAAVVSKRTSGELGFQLDTTVDTGPRTIGFKLTDASGGGMFRYGTNPLQASQWYYVTGVYDAAARTLDVYLNGVLDSGTLVGTVSATQQNSPLNVNIGHRPGASGYDFNGTIDEVRIYNRALTPAEIQADMGTGVGGGTPLDTIAPSAPGTLTATASGSTQVNLAWGAASDNVGVAGYRVERCAGSGCTTFAQIATPTGTSLGDTGLTANTSYSYRVRAADAAGNLGLYSNVGSATTAQSLDVLAPTVPTGLAGTAVGPTQVNLSWTASTDDVAVTGYILQRCLGAGCTAWVTIATPTGTSYSDTGLTPSTTYQYWVRATDAAGNLSAWSTIVTVTTPARDTTGLVASYGFDEGSGTAIRDASGQNNNGAASGTTWTTGKFGSALVFNGTSAQVTIPDAPSLRLTTAMSLEAWIFPTTAPTGWRAIVDKNVDGYYLMASTDNGNRPSIGGTWATGNQNTFGPSVLPVNTWTHLASTFDGSVVRLFVNGVQVASQTQTSPLAPTTATLQIGGDAYPTEYFAGLIDEVRIYNRALSPTEIQVDMTTPVAADVGTTPPPPPPPPPGDTVPPTVTLTSPATGASVANTVSVSANAADNVGVASVQFMLDGSPLGSPVTTAPYSVAWDTATAIPGSHVLWATATDLAGNSATSTAVSVSVGTPTGTSSGQWAAPVNWPIVAVHANLLATGEILAWDGQDFGNQARLWNPATGVFTSVPNSLTNMFCGGHCLLPDGRALVAGGHNGAHVGLRDTNLFNPATRTWSRVAPMAVGRWYPTVTVLPDGRVLVTSGEIDCGGCFAPIPEIYNPQLDSWTQLTGASMSFPYYPHMFVLGDGRVLAAATTEAPIVSRVLDLATQTWSVVDPTAVDGGSSAMYAPGKILKSGRSVDPDQPVIPATKTTYVLDMNQPTPRWRQTAPMNFARVYHTLTLLPDGTVLATGGGPTTDAVGVDNAVLAAELWNPATETWTTLAAMQRPRLYHSNALLLADARVLVLGGGRFNGGNAPTDQLSSEIFSPPYLFKGARPVITAAPSTAAYGSGLSVQTPDAASIGSVVLIRLGTVTHSFNTNQRIVPLQFSAAAGTLSVQTPANANLAPPGHYMLFILNTNGVPSVASIVQLR